MNFGVDVGIAVAAVESWAMFTLYQIVKRSITETVPQRLLFTLGMILSEQFLL